MRGDFAVQSTDEGSGEKSGVGGAVAGDRRRLAQGQVAGNRQEEDSPLGYRERNPDVVVKTCHSPFYTPVTVVSNNVCIISKSTSQCKKKVRHRHVTPCLKMSYENPGCDVISGKLQARLGSQDCGRAITGHRGPAFCLTLSGPDTILGVLPRRRRRNTVGEM